MVNAVLFDLDGTLWGRDGAVRRVIAAQHRAFPDLAPIRQDDYVEGFVRFDAHGKITDKADVYRLLLAELRLPASLTTSLRDHFWTTFPRFQEPFPEVANTLAQLTRMGLKLGIITNGNTMVQESKIQELDLERWMTVILISEREGLRKPDPAIFHRAINQLGVSANGAWFVGDHPDADVRGAHEAGLTAVLRRSWATTSDHADHIISTLDELIPLIVEASATETI